MLCHVLGYEDHCDIMETLRSFRDVKMKQAGCYTELLEEYDTVGPVIAHAIEMNNDREALCEKLLHSYIEPIVLFVKNSKEQEAVEMYREMVFYLRKYYNI